MDTQHWIFLSPHFDDVALSCGGLVWDLARQGHTVEIWTLLGGFPPDEPFSEFAHQNHLRWGLSGEDAVHLRRSEDHAACQVLGAQPRHFDWPDAIYRRDPATNISLVNNNDALFGETPEPSLITAIQQVLKTQIPAGAQLVLPIGLGNHVDHQAVAQAGQMLNFEKYYFADYPYILKDFTLQNPLSRKYQKVFRRLGQEALSHWQEAVLCYKSQLGDFWRNEREARLSLRNYQAGGGGRLWIQQ